MAPPRLDGSPSPARAQNSLWTALGREHGPERGGAVAAVRTRPELLGGADTRDDVTRAASLPTLGQPIALLALPCRHLDIMKSKGRRGREL